MPPLVTGITVRTKGFTLIEMLTVLVIIAIVLAVALISFGDFGASRKQELSLLQLKASMKSAQLEAILTSQVLTLVITQTGYYYIGDTDHHLSNNNAFPSKITGSFITSLYFLPDGTITPFNMTIIFHNHQMFNIFLSNSGEIHIEKKS